MELDKPFVRLPYKFDVDRLQTELSQFNDADWLAHPSGIRGNSAIPLVSQGGKNNNNFAGQMQITESLTRCDYMLQSMAAFNEVIARSRLMRLDAGAEVSAHVDFNYHWYSRVRIHIPIVTNPDVQFYCGDQVRHMRAGECWIFDSWRWHNVINKGAQDRVHLVVDVSGSARFWEMVAKMSMLDPDDQDWHSQAHVNKVAYKESKQAPKLVTEQYNVAPVMAPGEMHAIIKELIADFSAQPSNQPEVIAEYSKLLYALSHDWRSLWLQHGFNAKGWPQYRALLESTARQLRPNPRALITKSNEVGVNPIIMQRIIRAALNTDQSERFNN